MRIKKSEASKYLEKLTGGPLTMGRILKSTRLCNEMSQVEFAKKLGIPKQNLCDIEKGRRFVGPQLAAQFARKLGASEKQYVRIALQDQLSRHGLKYDVSLKAA